MFEYINVAIDFLSIVTFRIFHGLVSSKISACSRRVDFFQKRVEILSNRRLSLPSHLCTKIVKIFVDSQNDPCEISFHYERNLKQ